MQYHKENSTTYNTKRRIYDAEYHIVIDVPHSLSTQTLWRQKTKQPRLQITDGGHQYTPTRYCPNSTYSICCGFVVQHVVQQIHDKSTTTNPQQIDRLQQIHNISTCRDVVDLLYNKSESTTKPQQI